MATTKQFKDYILEQLKDLGSIKCKQMMGEYLLYNKGVLFGGLYDNRFLIKITNSNKKYSLKIEQPCSNAKEMFMVENLEDRNYLYEIITQTCKEL